MSIETDFTLDIIVNFISTSVVAIGGYLLWLRQDTPGRWVLQALRKRKDPWYAIWVPVEQEDGSEWVAQWLYIRPKYNKTLRFIAPMAYHKFVDQKLGKLPFGWNGTGHLHAGGAGIFGEWHSIITERFGHFSLGTIDADFKYAGTMGSNGTPKNPKGNTFLVASDIENLTSLMQSHNIDGRKIEKVLKDFKDLPVAILPRAWRVWRL